MSTVTVHNLRCEYKANPLGIDVRQPRLSWQLVSTQRGTVQTAYQIQVASTEADLETAQNLLWDSGKVESAQSVHVVYAGPKLGSMQRCTWRVKAWDSKDRATGWSDRLQRPDRVWMRRSERVRMRSSERWRRKQRKRCVSGCSGRQHSLSAARCFGGMIGWRMR